jgi:hypothetical protein
VYDAAAIHSFLKTKKEPEGRSHMPHIAFRQEEGSPVSPCNCNAQRKKQEARSELLPWA